MISDQEKEIKALNESKIVYPAYFHLKGVDIIVFKYWCPHCYLPAYIVRNRDTLPEIGATLITNSQCPCEIDKEKKFKLIYMGTRE